MVRFVTGNKYTRADIKELVGVGRNAKGGPWDTGILVHDGEFLIFANVGTEGRTGHDYDNRWEGEFLRWYHKGRSRVDWPSVKGLLGESSVVHVFWRSSNASAFEYAGFAKPIEIIDSTPVGVLWSFSNVTSDSDFFRGPDEISEREYAEGAVHQVQVNSYERDRAARRACINHYGPACTICGFVFEEHYGAIGEGYIHVHHLVPISDIGENYRVDPIEDLRPICPNCHAMIHRKRPPLTIEDVLRQLNE